MRKNPLLAAILNFAFFGGGTLYVGKRVGFSLALIVGGTAAQIVEIKASPLVDNSIPGSWPFLLGGLVLMKLALAVDGWREAKAA